MNTLRQAHICTSLLALILAGSFASVSAHDHGHGHHKHHRHFPDDGDVHYHYYYVQPPPVMHRHYHAVPRPYPMRYDDYGVRSGRCDIHTVAQVLGGVAGGALGGVLGSGMSGGSNAGTVVGAVAGTVLGAIIGDRVAAVLDPNDRFCAGRALDFAQDRHPVGWFNPQSQIVYQLTPLRSFHRDGVLCREFTTMADGYGVGRQIACRLPTGDWDIRG